ncbi:MAG: hypothetical protein ACREMA_00280 [Longimicrobiales bacterium]
MILELDAIVRSPHMVEQIAEALRRTAIELRNSDAMMAWETIPLDLFTDLPASVQSCWVFLLRAAQDTGAERHPKQSSTLVFTHGGRRVSAARRRGMAVSHVV